MLDNNRGASIECSYALDLMLSYVDSGTRCTMPVKWPPWWTRRDCYREQTRAGAVIMGSNFDDGSLRLFYHGERLLPCSLKEQGVEDNSIIQVVSTLDP